MRVRFLITSLVLMGCHNTHSTNKSQIINQEQNNSNNTEVQDTQPDASLPNNLSNDGGNNIVPSIAPCGTDKAFKCKIGQACQINSDCASDACRYDHTCIAEKSCVNYLGGNTCGSGEVGDLNINHESCCKSLLVSGYVDPAHSDKQVYLDKYEITAGRVRTFIQEIAKQMNGKPNVKSWIANNKPSVWNAEWEKFLPSDYEGDSLIINRLLLGDPRHDNELNPGPGVIVPPETDQTINVGLNYQFGGTVYVDLHGNNCGVFKDAYGFPTYYYPSEVLIKNGEVPRANGIDSKGQIIQAQDVLDVKSMNCITNAMLQVFCHWDGGQLATSEVLDYITQTPISLGNTSGCGTQIDYHGIILDPNHTLPDPDIRTGGVCPDLININSSFDGGGKLPTIWTNGTEEYDPLYNANNFLNINKYNYPDFINDISHNKTWQIEAPGRITTDVIKLNNNEGWMDLAGNLNEAVLETKNGTFTGNFGLKYRGIAYGSARSTLNVSLMPGETILRIQRPESKAAYIGGRCLHFL